MREQLGPGGRGRWEAGRARGDQNGEVIQMKEREKKPKERQRARSAAPAVNTHAGEGELTDQSDGNIIPIRKWANKDGSRKAQETED